MKIAYIKKRFHSGSLEIIDHANDIIEEYQQEDYDLTLRQLYYQFVARDIIQNKQSEYNRLGSIINDARLAGLIDWDSIIDRTREYESLSHWNSPADILKSAAKSYNVNTRINQNYYIEVWVEKDALVGVIEQACDPLDVGYLSCRGYVSQSEMWRSAQRFNRAKNWHNCILLHFGDHDPSGIDMTRDIEDRLNLFDAELEVSRIALTMEQIEEFNPPPNPAKTTDSRYNSYIKAYGEDSWELDALDPRILTKLINENVNYYTEKKKRNTLIKKQEQERKQIFEIANKFIL